MKSKKVETANDNTASTNKILKALAEVEEGMYDSETLDILRNYYIFHAKKKLQALEFAERNGCSAPEHANWRTFDLEKHMNSICSQLVGIESMSKRAEKEMQSADLAVSDIMHELELLELDDVELIALAEELAQLRKYRREAKNFVHAAAPVVKLLTKERAIVDRIREVSGNVRDIKAKQKVMRYAPRKRLHTTQKFEALKDSNSRQTVDD